MATNTNIKNALSFSSGIFHPGGKTVGNAELVRIQTWFEAEYANELDGASATADDLADWLWRQIAAKVKAYEAKVRDAANTEPPVADLTE